MDRVRMEVELIGPRRVDELRRLAERQRLAALASTASTPARPWLRRALERTTDIVARVVRPEPASTVDRRGWTGRRWPAR